MAEPRTIPFMIRMDRELLAEFQKLQPDRGDVAAFVNTAMREFIRLWGDRPTPKQVTSEAVRGVFQERFG